MLWSMVSYFSRNIPQNGPKNTSKYLKKKETQLIFSVVTTAISILLCKILREGFKFLIAWRNILKIGPIILQKSPSLS